MSMRKDLILNSLFYAALLFIQLLIIHKVSVVLDSQEKAITEIRTLDERQTKAIAEIKLLDERQAKTIAEMEQMATNAEGRIATLEFQVDVLNDE